MYRRAILVLLLSIALAGTAVAEDGAAAPPSHPETARILNIRLWPGEAPGSEAVQGPESYDLTKSGGRYFWNVTHPMMTALFAAKPSGASILLIPGGGYRAVHFDFAVAYARWFNTQGIDAYVLKYRLPDDGHKNAHAVPLQDAQRAMRLIRSGQFTDRPIDTSRIGVMGLSAGGHLAAVLTHYPEAKVYDPRDAADALSPRPDFTILAYAVLPNPARPVENAYRPNTTRFYKNYPLVVQKPAMPPVLILQGRQDTDTPYGDAEAYARRLQRAGVPVELHVFDGAGHSFGVEAPGEARHWPALCSQWLKVHGIVP